MKKILFGTILLFILSIILTPQLLLAQEQQDEILEAKVTKIVKQRIYESPDGVKFNQQNLELLVTKGSIKGKTIKFNGISDLEVINQNTYQVGDRVLVAKTKNAKGDVFYITDYMRRRPLWLLGIIFILSIVIVGKMKGLRAFIILILTFLIIVKFIIPQILNGANPLIISILSSIVIAWLAIFGTDGFNKKTKISFITIVLTLGLTIILSYIFTVVTKLTGGSEEINFILTIIGHNINVQGILLAGMVLGTLGVLDDVIISQVSSVKEISESNPELSKKDVYKKAMRIGTDHINAMINTLFLAYAGAALPLLILFSLRTPPFLELSQIINNELIATEIVRTLTGSIALILAVPLATLLAVRQFVKNKI